MFLQRPSNSSKLACIGMLVAAVLLVRPPSVWASGTVAAAVLGQVDFTHSAANSPDAVSLSTGGNLVSTAVDKTSAPSHLFVTDFGNNRVLGYNSITALTSGAPADLVIGQPDFFGTSCNASPINGAANLCSPRGLAVDSLHNLYVADAGNNRVLVFADPFAVKANTGRTAGFAAFMVLGQAGDFTSIGCNVGGLQPSASTLCQPEGLAVDGANNLYAADTSNNRVLVFNNPVGNGSLSANLVLGQTNFTANLANQGGTPARTTLSGPVAVAVDSHNNVYVADFSNNRVLMYIPPLTNDANAAQVWGQGGSFILGGCNTGGASATTLCEPTGVALDSVNNLYIADFANSRVLEYNEAANPPNNRTANLAFGQANTTTFNGCNQGTGVSGAATLCFPSGPSLDASNNLFVVDGNNNRVLEYLTPLTNSGGGTGDATADVVLGQADFTHNVGNNVDAAALSRPLQVAVDVSGHLWFADSNNNRVLGWQHANTFANGAPADVVIGQADFQSAICNAGGLSGKTLCTPTGVAVDASSNLYVVDNGNSRMLEFTAPFATCGGFPCVFGGTANKVFGQTGATVNGCNNPALSANSLCAPTRVALDRVGNLYVADESNHRVLEYNTPLAVTTVSGSGDTTADLVFGQGITGKGAEFGTGNCNQGGLSAHSLCNPDGVGADSANNVYVVDSSNNRALEFNEPTTATVAPNNVVADTAFGQLGSFTTNSCNNAGLSADSLCVPAALSLDSSDNLFVGDQANSRVLEYFTPLTLTATFGSGDTTADIVWGQGGSFLSNSCNLGGSRPSAATLCHAEDAVVDGAGNVFITDRDNNRLLRYQPPFTPPGFVAPGPVPAGMLSVQPAALIFRPMAVGRSSRPKRLIIRNASDTPVQIGDIRTSSDEFVIGGTCGSVVPAGGSCTLRVAFKPLTTGHRGAQLVISHDGRNNPYTVRLRGAARPLESVH